MCSKANSFSGEFVRAISVGALYERDSCWHRWLHRGGDACRAFFESYMAYRMPPLVIIPVQSRSTWVIIPVQSRSGVGVGHGEETRVEVPR